MKRLLTILLLSGCVWTALADNVSALQKQQKELKQQMEQTNKMLQQTKKNETATVTKLELINQNIKTQKALIRNLDQEIHGLDNEIAVLNTQRTQMQQELVTQKQAYAKMVRESHYAQMQQSPLLFLLSAKSFQQLIRRIRYMQELAVARREQVTKIEGVKAQIEDQNSQLCAHKQTKQQNLKTQQKTHDELARNERKQQQMLKDLKKKEKDLQAQLKQQQKKADELNKKIEATIAKQAQTVTTLTKEQQIIAGGFEQNKGRLPWPIEKGFISGTFGKHQHPVYKDVTIDNKGIYLQTTAGAAARAVFEGEVTSCFMTNGTYAVIVMHGNYRTVYAGLSRLSVRQGDKVEIKQKIGTIYTDTEQDNKTELFFQIWKDKTILNPSSWISQ